MIHTFSLCIGVVACEPDLPARLAALPVREGLSVHVEACASPQDAAGADIVFLGNVPERLPPAPPEWVLVAPHDEINRLGDRLGLFSHLWPTPLSDALLTFYYARLLDAAYERRACETASIWLDTLINSVPDLIWFKDARGSHLKVNEAFGRAVGKTPQQCEGRGHYYIWDLEPDEYAKGEYVCLETEEEVLRRRETCLFDEKVKSKTGLRQFKTYKSPLIDVNGELFGTVGIAKDVTDFQNIGRELELLLSSAPFATLIADEHGDIVNMNAKFEEYFGVTEAEALQLGYASLCEDVLGAPLELLAHGNEMEVASERSGTRRVLLLRQQKISDIFGNAMGLFLICVDMTTEHELRRRLLHSANTDFLTGLHNRRYFYEALTLRGGPDPVSLVYFDLDNFKSVNDTHGHQVGDRALTLMAKLLCDAFPHDLATRLGGDEYIIARFGECDAQELRSQVERFLAHAREAFLADSQFRVLSVSAGIACGQDSMDSVDALIARADAALYLAKTRGKSCYAFYGEE